MNEEQINQIEFADVRESKRQRHYGLCKLAYSISRIVLICVTFSLMVSMIIGSAGDYKILSLALMFLLINEFFRSINFSSIIR